MQFDKIQCLDQPQATTRWQADIGTVTIENQSVTFGGKRHLTLAHVISVNRVSHRAFAHDLVQVDYSDGQTMSTVYLAVAYRRGGAEAIDKLFGMLDDLRESPALVSIAPQAIETHREQMLASRAVSSRQAEKTMWIGAIVLLIGAAVTTGTYIRAASTGGIYIVAYGAILVGLSLILRGFTMTEK